MDAGIGKLLVAAAVISAAPVLAQNVEARRTPEEYFLNYALSSCLADGYAASEVKNDAAAAARAYLELGSFPLEAHTEATLLARKQLSQKYSSASGVDLTLMKCLDLLHSKALGALVKKYRKGK
jgi:hypothetical protein